MAQNYKGTQIITYRANDKCISLNTDGGYFAINAEADCCSTSWFEFPYGDLDEIIGKTIEDINFESVTLDRDPSGVDDCDLYYNVTMSFDDDTEFLFLLINSSNGYYSGWISIS